MLLCGVTGTGLELVPNVLEHAAIILKNAHNVAQLVPQRHRRPVSDHEQDDMGVDHAMDITGVRRKTVQAFISRLLQRARHSTPPSPRIARCRSSENVDDACLLP